MAEQFTSTNALEPFFVEHLDMLSGVIRHGYQQAGISIPPLDPLSMTDDISGQVELEKVNMAIKLGRPCLTGLSTINTKSDLNVDLPNRTVTIDLSFSKLQLSSEDFHLNGSYKILLLKHNLKSDGSFNMLARDIKLSLTLGLDIIKGAVTISNKATACDIQTLDFALDDSYALSKLLPFFKSRFEQLISDKVGTAVAGFINARLQQVCRENSEVLTKLEHLYQLKQQQLKASGEPQTTPRLLQGFDGVGELPLPMFWQVPAIDPKTAPHIDLEVLVEQAQTGDLILFAGSYPSSLRIRRLTQSRYSHVVVVIKEPEIQNGRACIWQATSSFHHGVLRNMERKSGIQLNYLEDMLRDYRDEDANSLICYRKAIQTESSQAIMRDNWPIVREFINKMDGKPYTDDMDGLYIMGLMEIDNPNDQDYFCAGLVAETLMKMQLLGEQFRQYQYAPRDFSELQQHLPLAQPPMHYGQETLINKI